MNRALIVAFLNQRLTSPLRMVLLAMTFLFPLAATAFTVQLAAAQSGAYMFALVIAAGAIGQDVSSGVLQLTFARPVSRPVYVTSRWFAATALATAIGLLQVLLGAAIVAARGGPVEALTLVTMVLENAVLAGAASALLLFFSSLVNGLGDVAIYFILFMAISIAEGIVQLKGWQGAALVLAQFKLTLKPELTLGGIAGHGAPAWGGLVSALSTTALCLALAIMAVNRKELSYAAG